jgi:hypothetical protein
LFAAGAKAEDEVEGAAKVLDEIDSLSAETIDKEAAESTADGTSSTADQGSKAVVDDKKCDYLFSRAAPDAHNSPRSLQNLSQLNRIGVFDNPEGRNLIAQNLNNTVSTDSNIVRTFSDQYGTFQIRDSLLAGPNGVLKLETTWQMMTDGRLRMTTVIPMGGG